MKPEINKSHREKQYDTCLRLREKQGLTQLGSMTNWAWHDDPRRLTWLLARYKFVSKMLSGCNTALEVGCADAFASRVVLQEVPNLKVIDFDPIFIDEVKDKMDDKWRFEAQHHDILSGPVEPRNFDAAFTLDVIEHISVEHEEQFLTNITNSLNSNGILVVGTPSLESQEYASEHSKKGHVNCKSAPEWKSLLQKHFNHVFSFGMNDEVVHTGFHKMSQYLLMLCVGKNKVY